MSGKDKPPSTDNPIKNLIQDAYGMSTRECLKEFQDAEEHPDLSPELQAPSNGYQRIKDIIDLEGIPSAAESHKRKVIRLRRIWRPLVAVAVVGSVIWGFGIGASGQKFYGYRGRVKTEVGNNIVWNNDENLIKTNSEDEAYAKIKEELGIDVLELTYQPKAMEFIQLIVEKGHATIVFSYNDKRIFFTQMKSTTGKSDNVVSDHSKEEIVKNEWLQKEICINYEPLENGEEECEAKIEIAGTIYHLYGMVGDRSQFVQIVEGLNFFEK